MEEVKEEGRRVARQGKAWREKRRGAAERGRERARERGEERARELSSGRVERGGERGEEV